MAAKIANNYNPHKLISIKYVNPHKEFKQNLSSPHKFSYLDDGLVYLLF